MAFSKAKITRFNEIEGCAPPPGSYNPKLDAKLIGGVLSKTQRFLDPAEDCTGTNLNLSKNSGMSSTDDVSKTPRKTPKYLKPLPRSMGKPKKVSSLQDLSKIGQGVELRRLEEEVSGLQKQLHEAQIFKSRLSDWMSVVMAFAESESCPEDLQNIAKEWGQFRSDDPLPDIHFELFEKKKELTEAEYIIDSLRDQLGEATTNLSAMQALADQSELAYKQLQEETVSKSENFERILSQLQAHLNVVEQDKIEFQDKLFNTQAIVTKLEADLVKANEELLQSEQAKFSLQEQLLQKCDLVEEFLRLQEELQTKMEMSKNELLEANASIKETQKINDIQIKEFAKKYEILENKYSSSESFIETLKVQLLEATSFNSELETCKKQLTNDLQEKKNEILNLYQELEEVASTVATSNIDLQELQEKYCQLKADNCEKSDKIEFLSNELQAVTEAKGVLQVNFASVETTVNILKEKLVENQKLNEEKSDSLREAQANVASLLAELSSANDRNKTLEDELLDNAAVVSELRDQLQDLSKVKTGLQSIVDDTSAQLIEANDQRILLVTELENLQSQVEEQVCTIATLHDSKQVLQLELREASHQIWCLEMQLDNTVDNANHLQRELSQVTSVRDELVLHLERKKSECFDLQNQFKEINKISEKNEKALETLKNDYQDILKQNEQMVDTQEKIQEFYKAYQSLNDRVKLSEDMIKEHMTASSQLGKALDQTKAHCKEATSAAERIRKELLDCQSKLTETRNNLQVSEKSRDKLLRKLTGTKNVHKNTQEKLAAAELTISDLQKKLEDAQKVENNLKESLSSYDKTLSQLKTKVFDYEQSLNSMIEESIINKAVLVADVDQVKNEINRVQELFKLSENKANELKMQLNSAKQEVEAANEKAAQVEIKRAELEEKYETSTSNVTIIQEELMHAKEHLQEHMSQANQNISALQEQLTLALQQNISLQDKNLNLELELEWTKNETEIQKNNAIDLLENINDFSAALAKQVTELKGDNASLINGIEEKVNLIMQEHGSMQVVCQEAHETILSLKTELFDTEQAKQQVEDELHEMKVKVSNLQDQIFDAKQETEDLQVTLATLSSESETLQQEKKTLEEEYLKAEKEWDQREQELQLSWKLLSDEVKLSEEAQLTYETKIIELETKEAEANTAIKILKDENEWAECHQLELEASLNQVLSEKEKLIEELIETNKKVEVYIKNESVAQAGIETCKEQVSNVSTMLTELREELVILNKDFCEQDVELTELENLLEEREAELETLRAKEICETDLQIKLEQTTAKLNEVERQDEEKRLKLETLQAQQSYEVELRNKLEATEKELARQKEAAEKRADEMEELLHKKMEELDNVRGHVGELEEHTKCLDEQVATLAEAQQKAHEETKAAELQAHQATQALITAKEEFSQRWSTMEDSMLNMESIEAKSRELAASEASLRTQVSILDGETSRLRNGNCELRERLNQLEKTEAKNVGHQNQAQKLSYMQHLKEIVLKHQQNEEELHERLVSSDCRVAQLEAQLHSRRQSLGKSMLQHTASSLAKKTPRAKGKENDRSLLSTMYLSRSTSMLATSTPLHPKVLNR